MKSQCHACALRLGFGLLLPMKLSCKVCRHLHCAACMYVCEPLMVCKKCCSLFLGSCYGQALLTVAEDPRLSVLRRCLEDTETALEDQRLLTKSLRGRLQDLKTQALERLKGDMQRQMDIYEAGIEWMRANSPLVQTEIQKESEEVARLEERRKAVESRVESVKTALETAMKGLKVRKPRVQPPA